MVAAGPVVFAQEAKLLHANGPMPTYEVATVKPATDETSASFGPEGPSTLGVHNFTLKSLLGIAYGTHSSGQLEGVPSELGQQRYDIEIKLSDAEVAAEKDLPVPAKAVRWQLMLQELLADRFHLKTSEAVKEVPVYELVLAKGGPKLKPTAMEDNPAKPGEKKPVSPPRLMGKIGSMQAEANPMSMLADALGRQPEVGAGDFVGGGKTVIDKTGVKGLYDWTLTWQPVNASGAAAINPDAPGLFTALQEQLGVKLVPGKAPVQVLVVEHVERPTGN
jgi:uncharacterized protein (TIGR03435 family)